MLWTRTREGAAHKLLSLSVMTLMVFSLVSPGVAVFADESTETPAPVPITEELPPVEEENPTEVAPVEEEVVDAAPEEEAVSDSEEHVPAEPVDEVQAVEAEVSAEVAPVTVVAAAIAAPPADRGPRSDFPPPVVTGEYCELTTTAIFWAGQHTDAGSVSVTQDETDVKVTFTTTGGWQMGLTHLYVGTSAPGSYAPGSFPYQTTHNPKVTSYTYNISLASLGVSAGDTIYVSPHAEVHHSGGLAGDNGGRQETAWGGQGQWPGLHFTHAVGECEEPEPDPADVTVLKFNDLNENGVRDDGEPYLSGWSFTLSGESVDASGTTDGQGSLKFEDLAAGSYSLDEVVKDGWFATVNLPIQFDLDEGESKVIRVGNAQHPVTKTFELVYEDVPGETILYVDFRIDGEYKRLALEGVAPTYTAEIELPVGTVITEVAWRAFSDGDHYLLGLGALEEVLLRDLRNEYEYDPMVSGYKFGDLDANGEWDEGEVGLEGWLISLYRLPVLQAEIAPIDQLTFEPVVLGELVAQTYTTADGSYSFKGLLPGVYFVAEEDRAGWFMTVGPDGSFLVENGTAIEGLNFGNARFIQEEPELDLALAKEADVETTTAGGTITYTITYENVSDSVAENYTIIDDYDETLVTVLDSAGGVDDGDVITWTLPGPLAAQDGPQQITYTVQVNEVVEDGTLIENFAEIDHPRDSNPENNSDDDVVEVEDPFLPFTPEDPEDPEDPVDPEDPAEPQDEEEPFLPYTGVDGAALAILAAMAVFAGLALRRLSRAS